MFARDAWNVSEPTVAPVHGFLDTHRNHGTGRDGMPKPLSASICTVATRMAGSGMQGNPRPFDVVVVVRGNSQHHLPDTSFRVSMDGRKGCLARGGLVVQL